MAWKRNEPDLKEKSNEVRFGKPSKILTGGAYISMVNIEWTSMKLVYFACAHNVVNHLLIMVSHLSKVFHFLNSSVGKESACNEGDLGSIPGLRRSPGEGKGYPLQYSGLENSMDCIVHGVTKSQTRLSDFHFTADV